MTKPTFLKSKEWNIVNASDTTGQGDIKQNANLSDGTTNADVR